MCTNTCTYIHVVHVCTCSPFQTVDTEQPQHNTYICIDCINRWRKTANHPTRCGGGDYKSQMSWIQEQLSAYVNLTQTSWQQLRQECPCTHNTLLLDISQQRLHCTYILYEMCGTLQSEVRSAITVRPGWTFEGFCHQVAWCSTLLQLQRTLSLNTNYLMLSSSAFEEL